MNPIEIIYEDSELCVVCMAQVRNNSMYFQTFGGTEYTSQVSMRYYIVSESGITGTYAYKSCLTEARM